ncbi:MULTISPECIES: flavodoxin [Enterococcus]|uniref:flavodoxin n=1 Tax=Enterococcus TaxID=1350 RepID=UPI0026482039|nr:flavodoxin [Enterococcus entomosocium]
MNKWTKGLFLTMLFLTGCSSDSMNDEPDIGTTETSTSDTITQQMRETGIDGDADILIAYFTRPENLEHEPAVEAVSGSSFNVIDNTLIGDVQVIAEMIAEQTGGELFSIQTEVGYPNVYDEHTAFATREVEEDARPMLMADVAQMSDFDVIFIGFPVWWNRAPRAVLTFLEAYDLADKQIIPFATHGGSGLTNSRNELRTLYPDYQFLEGFAARAGSVEDAEPEVLEWLNHLGL